MAPSELDTPPRENYSSARLLIALGFLVAGLIVITPLAGVPAAVIFALLWLEKVISAMSQGIVGELGIEFYTVPLIFAGILYGPVAAFFIGFVGMPLLDSVKWLISPPKFTGGWPPMVPGPDSVVDGLVGAIAGMLAYASFPLEILIPVAVILKVVIATAKDMLVYGQPPKPTMIVNAFFNIYLAGLLSFIITL